MTYTTNILMRGSKNEMEPIKTIEEMGLKNVFYKKIEDKSKADLILLNDKYYEFYGLTSDDIKKWTNLLDKLQYYIEYNYNNDHLLFSI